MKILYVLAALCLTLASVSAANAVVWYDSNGFEGFATGALNGQDGWTGSSANGGVEPTVVTAPDPVLGEKAIRLSVGDLQNDYSTMDKAIADPIAAGYRIVTVSYDIYRIAPAEGLNDQNLWWWWFDAGTPTYGLQWDIDGTLPLGWAAGATSAPTVFGSYANVTMTWNLNEMKAYSWYNGAVVDSGVAITDIATLTGWTIQFGHESDSGTGSDIAYVDNFVVSADGFVPEPGSLLALASGLLGLGGLAIRRRR